MGLIIGFPNLSIDFERPPRLTKMTFSTFPHENEHRKGVLRSNKAIYTKSFSI
jgi:hypothetical protein